MKTADILDQVARHAVEVAGWAERLANQSVRTEKYIRDEKFMYASVEDLVKWVKIYEREKQ